VTIQRRIVGVITRQKLANLHKAALDIERLVRGGLARRRYRDFRAFKNGTVTTIQKHIRVWLARRRIEKLTMERQVVRTKLKAAIDLQRLFRGWKGRQRVEKEKQVFVKARVRNKAATKIQSLVRRRSAARRVDALRARRLDEMERAATFLRKVWLGVRTRKRYLAIQKEFRGAEAHIITVQRYVRGFICRLQLWREAVAAEDELWAVLQIQRHYRGYRGRVRAEDALELVWSQELGAAKIQRLSRGWLAYLRVSRMKKQIAHTAFRSARRRYQASQRIQAFARGKQSRKVTCARMARVVTAVTHIQRIFRGGSLRTNLWRQVENQRTTMIQALARGFLVRNRRFGLLAKVLRVQRYYRKWTKLSKDRRDFHLEKCRNRKQKATMIQRQFRLFSETCKVRYIQDPSFREKYRARTLAWAPWMPVLDAVLDQRAQNAKAS